MGHPLCVGWWIFQSRPEEMHCKTSRRLASYRLRMVHVSTRLDGALVPAP